MIYFSKQYWEQFLSDLAKKNLMYCKYESDNNKLSFFVRNKYNYSYGWIGILYMERFDHSIEVFHKTKLDLDEIVESLLKK